MSNKKIKIYIIVAILISAFFIIYNVQYKDKYIKTYIKQQMSIFQTPIPFIHKIQYFYDRAITFYLQKENKKAIENLQISKAFLNTSNIKNLNDVEKIIDDTITNISNNKTFDYKLYQKKIYLQLTTQMHNYYVKTHNMIKTLNQFIEENNKIKISLEITIFLFSLVIISLYILFLIKEQLKLASLIDPLTLSFNRRSFFEDIKKLPPTTHTLVMADIDHFKRINDTYGHDMGDLVLKEFVKIIKSNIRKEDKIYRWGGEEFLILFKGMNAKEAHKKIQEIKEKIETHNFNGIKITSSFGIKEVNNCITPQDLKILDNALYLSKEKGRNKVTILD